MNDFSGMERRITLRLLSYWEKLRKDRPMPSEKDIDPEDVKDLWGNCYLIRIKNLDKQDYHYDYLGQAIVDAYRAGLSENDPDGMISPNPAKLSGNYARVITTCKPVIEEGHFRS